ncbi:hypothetical protein E0493_14925 [Roseomonas sp. M0104]|uniref:Uncharacterized protein n=1 Tax=Teichococcus coralli TaxID=2545983 RepID=A0A845BF10_9PROT|nr:hypothetical protein [Pseudoroseomonas coralli]MXP64644.1 hypothetical protein [Pseudoroseomonas coralli]
MTIELKEDRIMRPVPLAETSSRSGGHAAATPLAEMVRQARRFAEGRPSPARGLLFGLFFSLLLWAAIIGFLLAL